MEYRYSVDDFSGDGYENAIVFNNPKHKYENNSYDLNDPYDCEMLAEKCASEFGREGGWDFFENGDDWIRLWLWITPDKKKGYNVEMELVPTFHATPVKDKCE